MAQIRLIFEQTRIAGASVNHIGVNHCIEAYKEKQKRRNQDYTVYAFVYYIYRFAHCFPHLRFDSGLFFFHKSVSA